MCDTLAVFVPNHKNSWKTMPVFGRSGIVWMSPKRKLFYKSGLIKSSIAIGAIA